MFNTIRKNQRLLMLVVVILTILAFTLFYTHTGSVDRGLSGGVGSIYGRVLSQDKIDHLVANYQLAVVLGLSDLLESLGGTANSESAAVSNFVFNQLIVEHEAKKLGIEPKDDQVARAITELPIFQTERRFDSSKYDAFIKSQLLPRGIKERQVEELVRNSLRVATLRKMVMGSVGVSDQEIRNAFRGYQKQDLLIAKFDFSKYTSQVNISENQIRLLYTKKTADLKSPETRIVRYVIFELPKEKAAWPDKQRIEALQAVANRAASFAERLSHNKPSLEEAAQKAGLTVYISPPFDSAGKGTETETFHGDLTHWAPTIFKLNTDQQLHSGALQGIYKTRFYVFELVSINPARPLTFEEAHDQLLDMLRKQAATKLLYEEGYGALEKISKEVRAGKSFLEATIDAGGKVQSVSRTSLYATPDPEDVFYNEVALFLSPGQVSGLQPSLDGVFAVFLQKRDDINPTEFDKMKHSLKEQVLKTKQFLLFFEWLRTAQEEANIRMN